MDGGMSEHQTYSNPEEDYGQRSVDRTAQSDPDACQGAENDREEKGRINLWR